METARETYVAMEIIKAGFKGTYTIAKHDYLRLDVTPSAIQSSQAESLSVVLLVQC